jgi:hypothetical protein
MTFLETEGTFQERYVIYISNNKTYNEVNKPRKGEQY